MRRKALKWADRGWWIAIEFEPTRSAKFERAVKMSRRHPNHVELLTDDGRIVYRNIYRKEELHLFWKLFRIVGGWKRCRIYLKGERVTPYQLFYLLGEGYWSW